MNGGGQRAGGLILGRIGKWLEVKKLGWVLYGRYLFSLRT